MRRSAGWLLVFVLLTGSSAAQAQEHQAPAASMPAAVRPLFEAGLGGSVGVVPGEEGGFVPLVDARLGLRLSRRFSLELQTHVWPGAIASQDIGGVYRTQLAFRPDSGRGRLLVGLGLAGVFDWERWPESRWTDFNGREHVYPGGQAFDMTLPVVPTLSVGYERIIASHLAFRADLTASVIPDDEVTLILLPAVSLSVPVGGRYARR